MLNVRTLLQNMYHQTRQAAVLTGYRIQLLEYLVHNKITSNNNIQRLQWHMSEYEANFRNINVVQQLQLVIEIFMIYAKSSYTSAKTRIIKHAKQPSDWKQLQLVCFHNISASFVIFQ